MIDSERQARSVRLMIMAGSRRRDAARARLTAGRGQVTDAELAERALNRITAAVEKREPLSGDQASEEVATEVQRMRVEKRAKDFVVAMIEPLR
jgi:hypothetical protein